MKILLVGAGVMSNYLIESIISSNHEFIGRVDYLGKGEFNSFNEINKDFDVIIDFSNHMLVDDLLEFAINNKKNILIATTGHSDNQIEKIKLASKKIAIIKATNTSYGINVLNKIISYATKMLKDYDIEIIESHHNRKIDAPSGTANTLLDIIDTSLGENRTRIYGRNNLKREEKEIGIHSIRAGNIVGEHTIMYTNNDEIIEVKHKALSRKIFADGAIKLVDKLYKLENGLYDISEIM